MTRTGRTIGKGAAFSQCTYPPARPASPVKHDPVVQAVADTVETLVEKLTERAIPDSETAPEPAPAPPNEPVVQMTDATGAPLGLHASIRRLDVVRTIRQHSIGAWSKPLRACATDFEASLQLESFL